MLITARTLLIAIVITISCVAWNNVDAEQVSVDIDENLLLKICRLKFCKNVNHIVSWIENLFWFYAKCKRYFLNKL